MVRSTGNRSTAQWAGRFVLLLCVYAVGSVGCSSDSKHDGVPPGGEEPPSDAGSAGDTGNGDSGGGKSGLGGAGDGLGQAGAGEGGSEGGDLALGSWDASYWDEALWQ